MLIRFKKLSPVIRTALAVAIACVVAIILFAIWLFWQITHEPTPQLIPLDNESATYLINKQSDRYLLHYSSPTSDNSLIGSQATLFIANSPVSLEPFVNKELVLTGEFVTTNQQCIENICSAPGGSFVGLAIGSVQVK